MKKITRLSVVAGFLLLFVIGTYVYAFHKGYALGRSDTLNRAGAIECYLRIVDAKTKEIIQNVSFKQIEPEPEHLILGDPSEYPFDKFSSDGWFPNAIQKTEFNEKTVYGAFIMDVPVLIEVSAEGYESTIVELNPNRNLQDRMLNSKTVDIVELKAI